MGWRVLYDDGTVFTPDDGEPNEAPAWGVVACISEEDELKVLTEGDDYYYWHPLEERWFGVDLIGLVDFLTQSGFLKVGRFIPQKQYLKILEKAMADVES